MHNDQENYDTFEYDQSDGEIPKVKAPPLPPARKPKNQDMQRRPLPPPKYLNVPDCDENYEEFPSHIAQDMQRRPLPPPKYLNDSKTGSLPRMNQVPSVPDCDENYEEFPSHIADDSMEENYECFDNDLVDNNPPLKTKPPLPNRKLSKEKIKHETKPQPITSKFTLDDNACSPSLSELLRARNNLRTTVDVDRVSVATESELTFKHTDSTKVKEKPLSSPKPSFISEINNRVKNFTLPGKDLSQNKSVGSESTSKAPKRGSFDSPIIPQQQPQPIQTEQDDTDDEDSREVYADACDVRLFLQNKPWYFGKLGRKAEESFLNDIKQNGAFLLRDSSQASLTHPFTLTVYSNNHFYRLKIRHLESGKFVVGEKKESEIEFNTIPDLITYYKTEPLLLLATANNSNSCTTLKYIPEKNKGNPM